MWCTISNFGNSKSAFMAKLVRRVTRNDEIVGSNPAEGKHLYLFGGIQVPSLLFGKCLKGLSFGREGISHGRLRCLLALLFKPEKERKSFSELPATMLEALFCTHTCNRHNSLVLGSVRQFQGRTTGNRTHTQQNAKKHGRVNLFSVFDAYFSCGVICFRVV